MSAFRQTESLALVRSNVAPEAAPSAESEDGFYEVISDPTRISALVGALVRHGAEGRLRQEGGALAVRPELYSESASVIRWHLRDAIAKAPFVIELCGYNSGF